jgi:hypothetical protein
MMKLFKKYMVWIVLLLTIGACISVAQQDDTVEESIVSLPKKVKKRQPAITASHSKNQVQTPKRHSTRQEILEIPLNIFIPYAPQQEMEEEEVIPSEAQMPANPFTYAGKLFDEDGLIVFLTDGKHNHTVKAGEIINDQWRIKSINPPELLLEYMPLGLVTTMQIGAIN